MRKTIYLLIILVVVIPLGFAETLTLTEELSVKLALEQNLSLAISQIDLDISRDQADNSWNSFLPDFSLTGGLSRSDSFLDSGSEESLEISDAEKTVEQARLTYQKTVDAAEQEVRTLLMQLEGYRENL